MKIVYMGTPDFAVESLDALLNAGHQIVGVITMPDKPAGRGQQLRPSPVKVFAEQKGLKILQPQSLKDEAFLNELRDLHADIQVVVAFRMLPEVVWAMPQYGTINIHASLLPDYRGAAPINWAIINGDKKTGVSSFLLKHDIDTGDIIFQESTDILDSDDAGTIHDRLMHLGAQLAVKTVDAIEHGTATFHKQDNIDPASLKKAPKIFKDDMKIDWSRNATDVINLIRGLSPYPAAWTTFTDEKGNDVTAKIFKARKSDNAPLEPGQVKVVNGKVLLIGTGDSPIEVEDLQLSGKKRMSADALLRGFHIDECAKCH